MIVFAVYDRKSQTYDRPMFFKTVSEAIRAFEVAVCDKDEQSVFSRFKEDFEFHQLGELNMLTGDLESTVSVVARGSDYLKDTHQYQMPLDKPQPTISGQLDD